MLSHIGRAKAPEILSWDWWMDGVIPTVGAVGALVVAVVALLISIGVARREREERARSQRASFAESVYRFLDGLSVAPPLDIPTLVTQIKRPLDQIRDEAAAGSDGAAGVARWVLSQTNECGKLILSPVPGTSEKRKAHVVQGWSVFQGAMRRRIRDWVATGVLKPYPIFKPNTPIPTALD
ncbi:hypothetical protein N3K63_12660 [Microbacterium sp. W1N]|uniref:hypothetical protein n=1 Tax=Microbacterium festucae TaxID=2977531 RepID=UPI0021C1B1DC|nr:hypothetical protein [Microbacterium festucae]MCT9821130.1 hypothetical protein [Microbacterium festucae]